MYAELVGDSTRMAHRVTSSICTVVHHCQIDIVRAKSPIKGNVSMTEFSNFLFVQNVAQRMSYSRSFYWLVVLVSAIYNIKLYNPQYSVLYSIIFYIQFFRSCYRLQGTLVAVELGSFLFFFFQIAISA